MTNIQNILSLMRVHQWLKNAFIVMPLIFSGRLFDGYQSGVVLCIFIFFSLLASGLYIINDIIDRKADSFHPIKRLRPIASGSIPVPQALALSCILILISAGAAYSINKHIFIFFISYLVMFVGYSYLWKHQIILDVLIIAIGFEIRIWMGSIAINVQPSIWLQLCVLVLSMFLGFIKRKREIECLAGQNPVYHRKSLKHYSPELLNQYINITATLSLVFYGMYVIFAKPDFVNRGMPFTIIFVVYGIFRYLYLTGPRGQGGDPGEIFSKDLAFSLNIFCWISTVIYIFYAR